MGDQALRLVTTSGTGVAQDNDTPEGLFRAHYDRMYLAAYRVSGSVQDAEDVLQSIFLKLLKQPGPAYTGTDSASYLCRAAINASLDLLRARARHPVLEIRDSDLEGAATTDPDMVRADQRRELRAAVATLNPREAEVFTLRHFEEFGNNEIAGMLGISASNVAVTLHRAREKLAQQLRDLEGGTS